jgi:RNA polymerase sigma-70 factor, ECF subfamily
MGRCFTPERWLDDHGRVLFKYAYARVRDDDLAEEIVQDTLLAAWRGRRRFAGKSSERTWLVGILKHRLADHWRNVQRRGRATESLEALNAFDSLEGRQREMREYPDPASPAHQPDTDLEQRQFWRLIADCIAALPPGQARAFRLCELDGLETAEICQILDIAPTNLWVMLHRARVRMREQLELRGFSAVLR